MLPITPDAKHKNCKERYLDFTFKEYDQKCRSLECIIKEDLSLIEKLKIANQKNELIKKNLLEMKKENENLKTKLQRTLFHMSTLQDKDKIIFKKQLNDFYSKQKYFKNLAQKLPIKSELKELIEINQLLLTESCQVALMLDSTKKQYYNLMINAENTFKMKVCEFSKIFLQFSINQGH